MNRPAAPLGPSRSEMRSRIRLRQLLLIDALAEDLSLHKAAARLGMTQSNATRLLQEMEDTLSVVLFERSKMGLLPTEHGRVMLRHARVLLADLEHARQEVASVSNGRVGTVRIGTLTANEPALLAAAIARACEGHPELKIAVTEGVHDTLLAHLVKGEVDLVIGRQRDDDRLDDLTVEVLYSEAFKIVCGPLHPFAGKKSIDEKMLSLEIWVLPPQASLVRRNLDLRLMSDSGKGPLRIVESVSILTTLELIRRGPILGIMPAPTAAGFQALGLVHVVPVDLGLIGGPVVLWRRATTSPSPVVGAFAEIIREKAREHSMLTGH